MNKTTFVILFVISFFACSNVRSFAQEEKVFDYTSWTQVLESFVDEDGLVDYGILKANRTELDLFIKTVAEAGIEPLSRNEKKAFWINAYNALTVRLIVDHYPLRLGGIRTINWGRPWNLPVRAAGGDTTLHDIEHDILRKWDPPDPRIHFAINCASGGCPRLPQKPFDPADLDQELHAAAERFINDPARVRLDREDNVLYASAIFDWFEEDFLVVADSVADYIARYLNEADRAYVKENDVQVKYLKYDWGLNEQK